MIKPIGKCYLAQYITISPNILPNSWIRVVIKKIKWEIFEVTSQIAIYYFDDRISGYGSFAPNIILSNRPVPAFPSGSPSTRHCFWLTAKSSNGTSLVRNRAVSIQMFLTAALITGNATKSHDYKSEQNGC